MTAPYQEVTQVIAVKAQFPTEPVVEAFVLTEVALNGDRITAAAAVTPGDTKSNDLVQRSGAITNTLRQVADHKSADDLWIIIDEDIYDVTKFQHEHPGGHKVMAGVAGKDATKKFDKYHRRGILEKYKKDLKVGTLAKDPPGQEARGGLFGIFRSRRK
ncbi:hypothetical protein LQW54_002705 [Pestalotiopsis sp. IQ-011]